MKALYRQSVRTPGNGVRALSSFSAFPLVFPAEKRIFVKTKQKRRTHEERGTDLRTLRKSVYRHRIQDYLRTTVEKSEYAVTSNELKNQFDIPIQLFLSCIGYQ